MISQMVKRAKPELGAVVMTLTRLSVITCCVSNVLVVMTLISLTRSKVKGQNYSKTVLLHSTVDGNKC